MRIAVNTRFLLQGKLEGIGIYTQELFQRIVRLMPEHEFYFLFDRPFDPAFVFAENVRPVVLAPPARHPLLWYAWFEFSVPRRLRKLGIDLFISPDGYASLHTQVPQILTLHDLGFEHFPEHVPLTGRWYYRHFIPKFARRASRIVAVSEYTRQDIIRMYQIAPEKIETIYNGFDLDAGALLPVNTGEIRKTYGLNPKEYFIFIGAVHPRKNVNGIIRAFEAFRKRTGSPYKLLLLGRDAWGNEELQQILRSSACRNDIIWIQNIERNLLLKLLEDAFALVFPSFFEGFGIPVLEAMQLGTPVITSNVSALPEVGGEAALYCDPYNPDSIADKMIQLAENPQLHASLVEAVKNQARKFSWDKSAEKWAAIIRQELDKIKSGTV